MRAECFLTFRVSSACVCILIVPNMVVQYGSLSTLEHGSASIPLIVLTSERRYSAGTLFTTRTPIIGTIIRT